jgi:hypothetical protein
MKREKNNSITNQNSIGEKKIYSKSDRAITLIALIVTIIVLLILAGVTINSVVGTDGVIKKSKIAVNEYKKKSEEEEKSIKDLVNIIDENVNETQEKYLKSGEYASNTDMYSDGTSLAVIPAGFTVSGISSENKISSGLVIYKGDLSKANWETGKDASKNDIKRTYNQYVWIPCNESDYKRTEWGVEADGSPASRASKDETTLSSVTLSDFDKGNGITNDTLNEIVKQISSEKNSVKKYGGFYIGRYEVGEGNVITQYKEPSANLKWSAAYTNAKKIDVGSASVSYLSSSYARDTALNFIQNNSEFKKYASSRNNGSNGADINENWQDKNVTYTDANGASKTKAAGTATRLQTGVTTAKCNIYDMGGNVAEFTTELNPLINGDNDATVVLRGGSYNYSNPAGYRCDGVSADYYSSRGFRATLFIQ